MQKERLLYSSEGLQDSEVTDLSYAAATSPEDDLGRSCEPNSAINNKQSETCHDALLAATIKFHPLIQPN